MKQAIITIDFRHYLVADPKKALAVIEILNASQRVDATGYNEFTLQDEPVDVAMQTLPAKTIIKPSLKRGGKKA